MIKLFCSNSKKWSENVGKILTGHGDDYTIGCLLHIPISKKYKMIAIDLSKQQALDADPKRI